MEKVGRASLILKWSRRIRRTLMLVVLAYLLVCIFVWATQRHRIFEPYAALQSNPERMGVKFDTLSIPSGTGTEHGDLDAWWLPSTRADAPTILYLHGNDKNMGYSRDIDRAVRLNLLGYNVLTLDYRGYGKSTGGEPSETKVYEDAEATWNYLIKQRAANPKRTFIFGHSLGGAIAIELAIHHPEAAGIIAESTFTSMTDVVKRKVPFLPVDLLLNQRFESLRKVGKLRIPLLIIHGTWDKLVPYQMGQRLYDAAPQPKIMKLVANGEHNNTDVIASVECNQALNEFIQRYSGSVPSQQ